MFIRLGQSAILQRDREEQDEKPADHARGAEHGELVAGEQLDQEGAAHRRDRRTDTQDTGDQTALSGRDLVGQRRHHGGEQRVEEQLGEAPSDEDHRDARGNATTRMPREPPTRPITIHGRRMPSRDPVRSLILPKNGLATMASRAPIPATSARLSGARSIPTSEFTFNAKVTSRGAMNNRLVLMYANAYSETKPQPTACAAGDPGSSPASAAVRSLKRSSPAGGGRHAKAAAVLPPGASHP